MGKKEQAPALAITNNILRLKSHFMAQSQVNSHYIKTSHTQAGRRRAGELKEAHPAGRMLGGGLPYGYGVCGG